MAAICREPFIKSMAPAVPSPRNSAIAFKQLFALCYVAHRIGEDRLLGLAAMLGLRDMAPLHNYFWRRR